MKAKEELAKVEKRAKKAMEKFKTSKDRIREGSCGGDLSNFKGVLY